LDPKRSDGCCAGSSEFLLPLDSTPAYLTHLAAAEAFDADFAEPAYPATAAARATAVSGSMTFSGFLILRAFR